MKVYIKSSEDYTPADPHVRKARAITRRACKGIALDMLENLSPEKKVQLDKMLSRNQALTSSYSCGSGDLRVYIEGFYLTLHATRADFSVWCYDNDGELIEGRKPNESKLRFLHEVSFSFNELSESQWAELAR